MLLRWDDWKYDLPVNLKSRKEALILGSHCKYMCPLFANCNKMSIVFSASSSKDITIFFMKQLWCETATYTI